MVLFEGEQMVFKALFSYSFFQYLPLIFQIMMKKILFLPLLLFSIRLYSQGCSDAGFCTMGAMKPDQNYSKQIDFKLRSLELNYYHGKTTLSPIVTVYTIDMAIGINAYNSIQIKLPYQRVEGNLGKTHGMGDISLSASRSVPLKNNASLGFTLGTKIPSGKSNIENNDTEFGPGGDLPMYYQISLGTIDAIAGASCITEKWLFATGIQVPVVHHNENEFRWSDWPDYPNQEGYLHKYNVGNHLKRGTDVMFRAERNFRFVNYNFSIGVLPIYRITKDQAFDFITDIANGGDGQYDPETDKLKKLDGTTGLALSALVSTGYYFNVNNSVKFIYGHKFTHRDFNPDGLTRKHVLSFSYIYRF